MRRTTASAALLLAVPLLAAPLVVVGAGAQAAPVATTVGEAATVSSAASTCGGTFTVVQGAAAPGGASYTMPASGVVTSFSSWSNVETDNQVRLILFGAPSGTVYPVKAKTPPFSLHTSSLNTFPVRVPVQAGWVIGGQFIGTQIECGFQTFNTADDMYFSGDSPDGPTMTFASPGDFHVNLSAVLEPDVDGDGYGDVSQDACPESALAVVACPAPDTTITKAPKKSSKATVKLAFTSTVARSTFLVGVDGKAAKEVLPPFQLKLKPGKHTVTVAAVSPLGITDPTPATTKIKISKPKPKPSG